MFSDLSSRFRDTLRNLRGQGRLTEANIQDTLRDVRIALLEADVALSVVRDFTESIKTRALGQEVMSSLTPGQALIDIVQQELTKLMGTENDSLNLTTTPPAVILMAGLQGSGKTTTTAKLGKRLRLHDKKSVLVVSCDIYRPAAILQLEVLAKQNDLQWFPSEAGQNPITIAKNAIEYAKRQFIDVVLVDTAGRLHIDDAMMAEIKELHAATNPIETLFVVDSMTGQDAVNTAKVFHDALPLTGVILTKTDGDARGGAALSIRAITGKPIKFMGTGEKTDALSPFYPDRVASQLLDMGDVLSLIEDVKHKVDEKEAKKMATKLMKGKGFTFEDFLAQLEQMQNLGGMDALLKKLPGMGGLPDNLKAKIDDKIFVSKKAIIQSMTPQERRFPDLIKASRKQRIAKGSGVHVSKINQLLKEFEQMQKMMKKMGKGGGMASMLKRLGGKLPTGFV